MRRTEDRGYIYPDEQRRRSNRILKAGMNQFERDVATLFDMTFWELMIEDVWFEYYILGYDQFVWWGSEYGETSYYNDVCLVNGTTGVKVTVSSPDYDEEFYDGTVYYVKLDHPVTSDITVPPLKTKLGSNEVDFNDPGNVILLVRIGNTLVWRNGKAWNYEAWADQGKDKGLNGFSFRGPSKITTSTIASGGGEESGSVKLTHIPDSDFGKMLQVKLTGDGNSSGSEIYFYSDAGMTNLLYSKTGIDAFTSPFVDRTPFALTGLSQGPTILYWKIINNGAASSAYDLEFFGELGEDW